MKIEKLVYMLVIVLACSVTTVFADDFTNRNGIVVSTPSLEIEGKLLIEGESNASNIQIVVAGSHETIWYNMEIVNDKFNEEIWVSEKGKYDVSIMKNNGNNRFSKEITFSVSNMKSFDKNTIPCKHVESTNNSIIDISSKVTKGKTTDQEKAFAIYNWISKNITYDKESYENFLNGDDSISFSAVATLKAKKGMNFELAALYCAMGRTCGLKVKLVKGMGVVEENQERLHAWNMVFDSSKNRWINVDVTFGMVKGDTYFDNDWFEADHVLTRTCRGL